MAELRLTLSATGRKYGYITWTKARDEQLRSLLGDVHEVNIILPSGVVERKRVDWKHHRISIGYTATRSLPEKVHRIRLSKAPEGRLAVQFEE